MKYDKEYEFEESVFVTLHCLSALYGKYFGIYPPDTKKIIDELLSKLRKEIEPDDEYNEKDIKEFRYVMQTLYEKKWNKFIYFRLNNIEYYIHILLTVYWGFS